MRRAPRLLVLLAWACHPAPIASCQDDLSGVWAADDGRRFHVLDRGSVVEVYPLFDPLAAHGDKQARPWRTPGKTELTRREGVLSGTTTFQAQDLHACTVVTPARMDGCGGDRAMLVIDLDPALDASGCAALPRAVPPLTIQRRSTGL